MMTVEYGAKYNLCKCIHTAKLHANTSQTKPFQQLELTRVLTQTIEVAVMDHVLML